MIVTTEEFQTYYGLNTDDAGKLELVDLMLATAQEMVENYIGYETELQTYTKVMNGNSLNSISLGVKPVNSIIALSIDAVPVDLEAETYYLNDNIMTSMDRVFPRGQFNITVSYSAGYSNTEATVPDVPFILKASVMRIAGVLWRESDGNIGINSVSDPNTGSRTFAETRFKKFLDPVLNRYKLVRL